MDHTELKPANQYPILEIGTVLWASQGRRTRKFIVTRVTAKRAYIGAHPDDIMARANEVEVNREASPVFNSFGIEAGNGDYKWEERGGRSTWQHRLTFYQDLPVFHKRAQRERLYDQAANDARYLHENFHRYGNELLNDVAGELASLRRTVEGFVNGKLKAEATRMAPKPQQ